MTSLATASTRAASTLDVPITSLPARRGHLRDEIACAWVHAAGLALSLVAAPAVVWIASRPVADAAGGPGRIDLWQLGCCSVYAAALVGVYLCSTLSHVFYQPHRRRYYRILDQAVIYLLVAGTYTPFAQPRFHPTWLVFLVVIWTVALSGCAAKLWLRRQHIGWFAMVTYLLLGWGPGLAILPTATIPPGGAFWLIVGGGFYSAGAVFLTFDRRIPFGHTCWHLFVVAGSASHYAAVLATLPPWGHSASSAPV